MSELTGLRWSNSAPYQAIENNPRVDDHEVIECNVCDDEASVISNNGLIGLCWNHYSEWCEQQAPEDD